MIKTFWGRYFAARIAVEGTLGADVNELARRQRLQSVEKCRYQRAEGFDPVCRSDKHDNGDW